MSAGRRERGVAMLTAILLVALGTVLATAIAFHSGMTARRAVATLAFDQALQFSEGAEALAGYALREDTNKKQDHLNEGWAEPLGPVEIAPGVVLEAGLTDLQSRFNLNSLVDQKGEIDPKSLQILENLLDLLGLEKEWAEKIADWIDTDARPQGFNGAEDDVYTSQDPPYRTPNTLITSTSELLALPEFGRERFLKLAPYVSALPRDATINVCTASGVLLDALLGTGRREFSVDPERLLKQRKLQGCAPTLVAYQQSFDDPQWPFQDVEQRLGENTQYLRLTSFVTIGTTQFALYSLLARNNGGALVRPILRSYTPD